MLMTQALTETESSVSLHISSVAERHHCNYSLVADNELGSGSNIITLAVVAPPGGSSTQQHVVDRPDDNEVVIPEVSRPATTRTVSLSPSTSSPSPPFASSFTPTANGIS